MPVEVRYKPSGVSGHDASDSDATVFGDAGGLTAPAGTDPDTTIFADVDAPSATPPAAPASDPDSTVYDPDRLTPPAPAAPPPARDRSPDASSATFEGVDRTAHAMAAVELGTLFRHRFATARFGISPRYRLDLQAPEGPSTAGGALARQSLVMFPDGRRQDRALVIGFVDGTRSQFDLRTHGLLSQIFETRFKRSIDVVESEYERLSDELRRFADTQGLTVRMLQEDTSQAPRPAESSVRQVGLRQLALFAIALLLLGTLIGFVLAR